MCIRINIYYSLSDNVDNLSYSFLLILFGTSRYPLYKMSTSYVRGDAHPRFLFHPQYQCRYHSSIHIVILNSIYIIEYTLFLKLLLNYLRLYTFHIITITLHIISISIWCIFFPLVNVSFLLLTLMYFTTVLKFLWKVYLQKRLKIELMISILLE